MSPSEQERLRALPAVDRVVERLAAEIPHIVAAEAARVAIQEARTRVQAGADAPGLDELVGAARELVERQRRGLLRPVINATGVLIHTNLGRAPLGEEQLAAVENVARSYSNLEYDLDEGRRGSRYSHARALLTALTGAESALVVNNNAAAVLLVLASLCASREVIISRGELIEIGGEFRIPDVMATSGARLVEVGTTNRTHMGDYERAITQDSAAILKVHPSNYRVVGFTASVPARELARLARGRGIMFFHDLGSGLVASPEDAEWTRNEPPVEAALADGADVVTFSGDKLLGGPQAGVIVGRADLIERIARHPLLRAVRPDKMTLAALEATLHIHLRGASSELPLWRMATSPTEKLETRARTLAEALSQLAGVKAEAVPTRAVTGGGSLPGGEIPSWAVAVTHAEKGAEDAERALRFGATPVIARIEDDRVLLDLRTVAASDDARLKQLVADALGAG
jgi:L-seryl-tRNA(Ser) seleniumtransferase